jgi:hypothetical protein
LQRAAKRVSPEAETAKVATTPDFDERVYAVSPPVETPHLGGRSLPRGPFQRRGETPGREPKGLAILRTTCNLSAGPQTSESPERMTRSGLEMMAEWTGLEPATPGVTGRYSNQLNYHSTWWQASRITPQALPGLSNETLASPRGFEPL